MSKLRKTKEDQIQAAKQSFQLEVKLQRVRFDMTQGELADAADMNRSVLCRCLADPDKLSVGRLRKIIQTLNIEPEIILVLLGYSQKQIRDLKCSNE